MSITKSERIVTLYLTPAMKKWLFFSLQKKNDEPIRLVRKNTILQFINRNVQPTYSRLIRKSEKYTEPVPFILPEGRFFAQAINSRLDAYLRINFNEYIFHEVSYRREKGNESVREIIYDICNRAGLTEDDVRADNLIRYNHRIRDYINGNRYGRGVTFSE